MFLLPININCCFLVVLLLLLEPPEQTLANFFCKNQIVDILVMVRFMGSHTGPWIQRGHLTWLYCCHCGILFFFFNKKPYVFILHPKFYSQS